MKGLSLIEKQIFQIFSTARIQYRWSHSEMAKHLNISEELLFKIEECPSKIPSRDLCRIISKMGSAARLEFARAVLSLPDEAIW